MGLTIGLIKIVTPQLIYAYSLTSHKAQGSTFDNVFVAQNDIFCNPNLIERYRSLYVSYSRTSQRLFINN